MEYIVTRWPNSPFTATQQATITVTVNAINHREALEVSGLKEPGALISVNLLGGVNIRNQVDDDGKVIELGRYGKGDKEKLYICEVQKSLRSQSPVCPLPSKSLGIRVTTR